MPAIAKKGILYTETPSVENRVVEGNQNPVTSGAVYKELGDTSVNNDLGANVSSQIGNLHGRLTRSIDEINEDHNTAWSGVVTVNNETKLVTFSVTIMNLPNGSVLYINKDVAPSTDTFFYSMMDGNNKVSLQFYRDGRVVLAQLNNDIPIVNTTISGMYISH